MNEARCIELSSEISNFYVILSEGCIYYIF
jgi:hypothetical protein